MNALRRVFPSSRHVILPVIHVESYSQAFRNALLAHQSGCDGVFLINHSISVSALLEVHRQVNQAIPTWWIGINLLGTPTHDVFSLVDGTVRGIWVDDACIDERLDSQPTAEAILRRKASTAWAGLYFGGVAFKYQRHVSDLASAARVSAAYMDVVTTSGPGTGEAASVEKIRAMKNALGDFPLAIASGLTVDNVTAYLDSADCFLVATGISSSWTDFDPKRLKAFVQTVRLGQ